LLLAWFVATPAAAKVRVKAQDSSTAASADRKTDSKTSAKSKKSASHPAKKAEAETHAANAKDSTGRAANSQSAEAGTKKSSKRAAKAQDKAQDTDAGKQTSSTRAAKSGGAEDQPAKSPKHASARHKKRSQTSRADRLARTARIKQAFVASAELRPMAQQLATMRTPEAYAGVAAYARKHSGEAAAAAYLALGHAYLLDKRYDDAASALAQARRADGELTDYEEFLGAQASHGAGDDAAAERVLHGFTARYPESIFADEAPELEASVLLALNNVEGARKALADATESDAVDRPGYQLALGEVELALDQRQMAQAIFKRLLLGAPLSAEAKTARAKLAQMGAESTLTAEEMRSLGDAYYKAGRYADAAEQYRALEAAAGVDAQVRNSFAVAEAACQLKLKRLTESEARALPDTPDDNGARRLELLMELARNRDDATEQKQIVAEMETRFPRSQWLAEALLSAGNMYLLKRDYPTAIQYYGDLAARFPGDKRASAAHWRAGWLSYRSGLYLDAAKNFDEQIRLYPTSPDAVAALYWRGRLYETQDHNPSLAAGNYRAIVRVYPHFFYAQMARQRLVELGSTRPVQEPVLDSLQPQPAPQLADNFPADSPHLAKARLLANAGLNEYIAREIKADPDSVTWSALAEGQIYAACGETFRALRALKRALPGAASSPIASVPLAYWRILFPEAWWNTIQAESAKNHLDPYLVASLIRQESEFNPGAISSANAYGLMQMLPAVGKTLAQEEGIAHFQTFQLLDPETNIRLGTRYLRQMIDHFGGVEEYALAAYNAGGSRVVDWKAAGPYSGIDEFVESIPFTQTREYVESIMRNVEIYRAIDVYAQGRATLGR
jgi:soluble lytic murein transglycosylase